MTDFDGSGTQVNERSCYVLAIGDTKFASYQLPGGENYRELLLTMPEKNPPVLPDGWSITRRKTEPGGTATYELWNPVGEPNGTFPTVDTAKWHAANRENKTREAYRSPHWDEPNVLAHVRMNDRVGPNGEKILHLEEIQSDWHQKGREKGYTQPIQPIDTSKWRAESGTTHPYNGQHDVVVYDENGDMVTRRFNTRVTDEQAIADAADSRAKAAAQGGVPDAPFKKTWPELALKRMLRYAAENGYDKLTWTTGDQQAERYDLVAPGGRSHSEHQEDTWNIRRLI